MFRHNIPKITVNQIRRLFIENPKFKRTAAAKNLGLCRTTITLYAKEFKKIKEEYPDKLKDFNFFMPVIIPGRPKKGLYKDLQGIIPDLIQLQEGPRLNALQIWREYKIRYPDGYSYSPFKDHFFQWCKEHDISLFSAKRIESFTAEQIATLQKWRLSNDRQHWQIAVVLEAAHTRKSLLKTMEKVECSFPTIMRWLRIFEEQGLVGFKRTYTVNEKITAAVKTKMDNLIHLVRQSPKIYGISRTAWTTIDLAMVYSREYQTAISQAAVSKYLRKSGIRYRNAKEVLTSPDPLYREKFAVIQQILENLTAQQKFFSIDEFGPCSIKPRGGKVLAFPGEKPIFPQVDKGKGYIICTAALELSTNQITHFYSKGKDTTEMIKMITILIEKYRDQERLFISWDAASWHHSHKLLDYIDTINHIQYRSLHHTPWVQLAPLPASAQFLNVIESVFSGLAKSVLHNSDYASVGACREAIDRYFEKRNQHFLENPRRAGNKIWGKERVKPVFDKANNCK